MHEAASKKWSVIVWPAFPRITAGGSGKHLRERRTTAWQYEAMPSGPLSRRVSETLTPAVKMQVRPIDATPNAVYDGAAAIRVGKGGHASVSAKKET